MIRIKTGLKKDWSLTQDAFRRFLDWLDEGTHSGGEKYLEVRRRLVSYFDRKNCRTPDDLADETLNRVARRLEEEGAIKDTPAARYCYIVAKFVFLEYLRRAEQRDSSLDDMVLSSHATVDPRSADQESETESEQRISCFEKCLQDLDPENRDLIIQYYCGEQRVKIDNRRKLAERLNITTNALSIRACRIRDRLESCVSTCLNKV